MKKSQRAELILNRLQELYPNPPIPLDHHDPFTLLIAVLLSAQCTDERVNKVTPALFRLADTPPAMANVPVEQILDIIRSCGLSPRKSKAISGLSKILVDEHDSQVPEDIEALGALAWRRPQNRQRRYGAGVRGSLVSCRHTYPPAGSTLGADEWKKMSSKPNPT